MISVPITWICEPSRAAPDPLSAGPEYDAGFVDEVGRFAGVSIPLVQGFLRDAAPADGIILLSASAHVVLVLDECAAAGRAELARRLVAVGGGRTRIFENLLEPLSLAAAVDGMTLLEWKNSNSERPGAHGPYGRRDIGQLVGASCLLFESERYCYLHSPTHHGLPHLLADYLAAYANAILT